MTTRRTLDRHPWRCVTRWPALLLTLVVAACTSVADVPATPASQPAATPATSASRERGQVMASIPLGQGRVQQIAVGEGAVWVLARAADFSTAWVVRIDLVTNRPDASIPLGSDAWDIAAGAGGVWVTRQGPVGSLVRLDPHSGRVVAEIGGDETFLGPYVAVGAGAVWTANSADSVPPTVSRIDPDANRVVATIPVGPNPEGIAYGAGAVWTADHDAGTVTRIDPSSNQVVASIPLGIAPHGIAADDDAVWVVDYHEGGVVRIDPHTSHPIDPAIRLGFQPKAAAVEPGRGVWVRPGNDGGDLVARVDTRTGVVAETIQAHASDLLFGLAVGEGGLWVAGAAAEGDVILRIAL